MPRGNKSYIHRASKNSDRNLDAKKIDPIQMYLIRYGISTVRERETYDERFNTKNHIRVPDLTFTQTGIIMEHDTMKIHGELTIPNERTIKRNCDYIRAGKPFFVINSDLAKELELDESRLASYLYYHEYMKLLAEAECQGLNLREYLQKI